VALLVVLAISLTSLGLLVVLGLALIRHVKLLFASVAAFRDQAQPVLQEILDGSIAAQERLERMSGRRRATPRPLG
jgi:hypothetical protein